MDWHVKNHHGWESVQESNDMNIRLAYHVPRTCDKCGCKATYLYEYDGHTWSEDCSERYAGTSPVESEDMVMTNAGSYTAKQQKVKISFLRCLEVP